jgi:hypothetical protein
MAATTLTQFIARSRELADMVNSSFVTDTADSLYYFINEGIRRLHELVVESFSGDYFEQSTTVTGSGVTDYDLPADFFKLLEVDIGNNGAVQPVLPYVRQERNVYRNASVGAYTAPYRYKLTYNSTSKLSAIRILPALPTGVVLTIRYVPEALTLAAGSDSVNYPNNWQDRFVPLYAAIRCLQKEESDYGALQAELQKVEGDIRKAAELRDATGPDQAVDMEMVHIDFDRLTDF